MRSSQAAAAGRRRVQIAVVAVILAVVALFAIWQVTLGGRLLNWAVQVLTGPAYLLAFPLLFVEEAGVPLPLPGDVFVMYVGHRVPHSLQLWAAAWAGFVACVVFGASILYWIARRLGHRVVVGRFGMLIHLTPERLQQAEGWFERWGLVAVIFGRHVPGGRIPITVAAGILEMPYPLFALGVGVSAAVWAAFYITVGVIFGGKLVRILQLHQDLSYLVAPAALLGIVIYASYRLLYRRRRRGRR